MKNLTELLKACMNELDTIDVPYTAPFSISQDRAVKRWGCCYRERIQSNKYKFKITITKYLCDDKVPDEAIKKVIIHELLHTCPNSFEHGTVWQMYARIVHDKLGYDITRTDSYESLGVAEVVERPKYKYLVKCTKCGSTWKRLKASNLTKHPELYHCQCDGKLTCEEVQ